MVGSNCIVDGTIQEEFACDDHRTPQSRTQSSSEKAFGSQLNHGSKLQNRHCGLFRKDGFKKIHGRYTTVQYFARIYLACFLKSIARTWPKTMVFSKQYDSKFYHRVWSFHEFVKSWTDTFCLAMAGSCDNGGASGIYTRTDFVDSFLWDLSRLDLFCVFSVCLVKNEWRSGRSSCQESPSQSRVCRFCFIEFLISLKNTIKIHSFFSNGFCCRKRDWVFQEAFRGGSFKVGENFGSQWLECPRMDSACTGRTHGCHFIARKAQANFGWKEEQWLNIMNKQNVLRFCNLVDPLCIYHCVFGFARASLDWQQFSNHKQLGHESHGRIGRIDILGLVSNDVFHGRKVCISSPCSGHDHSTLE